MSSHAVDFGTSNSLLSFVSHEGIITPIHLDLENSLVLRSLLYTPEKNVWFFGNEAIKEYVNHEGEGRFFRSIKKFLPEPSYSGTTVFNRNMNISELVAVILGEMRKRANKITGIEVDRIVLGRPALYSRDLEHDKLAQERMEAGARLAGYKEVIFCPEPVAAGLDYLVTNQEEKIILITDFGGGTSDFTLMKIHKGQYSQDDILGLSGIFSAGDVLDGLMMRDFISPHFGSKFEYKLPGGNNILHFPRNLLKKICSPAHITHLREKDTWEFLKHINKFALNEDDEKKMHNLFTLVEAQLGFPLFHEIEKTKIRLGKEDISKFNFHMMELNIEETIHNVNYNQSVLPTVDDIMATMKEVFSQSGLRPEDVDRVCLTGGTSQFPLIKNELVRIFGGEKIVEHNIYHSVINGLAQFARKL